MTNRLYSKVSYNNNINNFVHFLYPEQKVNKIVNCILKNNKKINKILQFQERSQRWEKAKNFVIAEAKLQKIKLAHKEIVECAVLIVEKIVQNY